MRTTIEGKFVVKAFADKSLFVLQHPTPKKREGGQLWLENREDLDSLHKAIVKMQDKLNRRPQSKDKPVKEE